MPRRQGYPRKGKRGEFRYVDFDWEVNMWCIFGSASGFCYATYSNKEEADGNLARWNRDRANTKARHEAYTSCGMVRVKGNLGGTYYE